MINVSFIVPYEGIAFVSETPKKINWKDKLLHSTEYKAVEYSDGYGLYSIHGVKFTEEQFKKSQTASTADILSWEDIDQRSVLLRDRPLEELLEEVPKKLIDKTEECGGYELYEIELKDIGEAKILSYKGWSSDKPYVKFVNPESNNCLETVSRLRKQTVEELINSIKS